MSEALVERHIRCLLFDLGDTLWYRESRERWETQERASNLQAVRLLRQHIDPASLPKLDDAALGKRLHQAFDQQIRAAIRTSPILEPDAGQALSSILQEWGIAIERDFASSLFEALRVRIPSSRALFPDAISTLTELRRRGFLLGVVTNRLWGGEPFYEDLQTMGLLDYFDRRHIAISGDLGIRKPNAQIFLGLLRTLQVQPGEVAMIGDSLSADILGAQAPGIYTIWKPKPWLREWALMHTTRRTRRSSAQNQPVSPEAFPGIDTADTQIEERAETTDKLLSGMYNTDDDYILARANQSRDYLEQFQRGEIVPEQVIGDLHELLEIFPTVEKS